MAYLIEEDRKQMLAYHYWEQDEFEREMIRLEALEKQGHDYNRPNPTRPDRASRGVHNGMYEPE
jgi:hypothetical protein